MDDEKADSRSVLPGHPTRARRDDERDRVTAVGEEPDPRFTFANERTFLAWNRTALGLIAAGAAAAAFLDAGLGGARLVVALPLMVLGAVIGVYSFRQWEANERAMRLGDPLPNSRMPQLLAATVAVIAAITAVLVIIDLAVR